MNMTRQSLTEQQNPQPSGFRSLAHAQASRGGAGRHALRSIGCAARAYKASEDLARHAINGVRSRHDAIGRRRTGITFRTGRPWRASGASGSLRSRRATFAAGSRRPLCPGLALRALRSDGARWARRTGSAALADGALWTDGSLPDPVHPADQPDRPALEGQLRPPVREDLAALVQDCNPPS